MSCLLNKYYFCLLMEFLLYFHKVELWCLKISINFSNDLNHNPSVFCFSIVMEILILNTCMFKVRVPVGRLVLELPAGMLDDDKGDFVGTAVREVLFYLIGCTCE